VTVLLLVGQAGFTASAERSVTVAPGDTLWGLSKRYGIPLNNLAAANGMNANDILLVGRRLRLSSSPIRSGAATAASQATGAAAAAPRRRTFSAAERAQMRTFCDTYRAPTGRKGLPAALLAHPERVALRPLFVRWARTYGVSPDLVEAVAWQESGWQNDVVSSADAVGIGQLLPETAQFVNGLLGTHLKMTVAEDNIRMEARYLAFLLQGTGGRVCEAVVSYYQGFSTFVHIGVLPESQVYVRSVLGMRYKFA
jgi:soluble lytic murein transglycosylase-like protein